MKRLEDEAAWRLESGVQALGKLISAIPSNTRGPVLTTNFDPLVEVAVRKSGARPAPQFLDMDGKILSSETLGHVEIIHVHGYWRRGDTLHTVHQLTQPRPMLDGSLRETLRGHVVVVMGYGGWKDAFTVSLMQRVREQNLLGMEVIWSSYSQLSTQDFDSGIFSQLVNQNAVAFYHGIDLNAFFPQLLAEYIELTGRKSLPTAGLLPGWTRLDEGFFALRSNDSMNMRLAFFDGHEPDWQSALDSSIPRLSIVARAKDALQKAAVTDKTPRIVLMTGPMGEGKSIALRQAAIDYVHNHEEFVVLWREPGSLLHPAAINGIPKDGSKYLLISDEADLILDQLLHLDSVISGVERQDIWFLLTAQERDWRNRGGFVRLAGRVTVVPLSGLSQGDAEALVSAWEACGPVGLGELQKLEKPQRVKRLMEAAVSGSRDEESNSLIGAMLTVRYGEQLRFRVRDLLERLGKYGMVGSRSLREAFLMIAVLHASLDRNDRLSKPLSTRILGSALGLDSTATDFVALEPLGKEAAVARHGGYVYARHISIAEAALDVSRAEAPNEVSECLEALVKAAIEHAEANHRFDEDHYGVAYVAKRLDQKEEALAAARAAIDVAPSRLSYRTSLISVLRRFGDYDEGIASASAAFQNIFSMLDPGSAPGFLREWATISGVAGRPTLNVLLDALAISVPVGTAMLDDYEMKWALLGMGVGFTDLHLQTNERLYLEGLEAIVSIVARLKPTSRQRGFFWRHKQYCDEHSASNYGTMAPESAIQILESTLNRLCSQAPEELRVYLSKRAISLQGLKKMIPDETDLDGT